VSLLNGIWVRPWTDLRGVANSSAAKSTILIPLIGYWILFNETIAGWLRLISPFADSGAHVSYRVLWTYIGLSLIAVGTFVYAVWCPPEIKKYGDYRDYVKGDGPAMTKSALMDVLEYLETKGFHELREAVNGMSWDDAGKDIMSVYFDYRNTRYPPARCAVTILYYAGFIILGLLAAQIFWKVLVLAFG
jgi:hypothetical protein